MMHLIDLREPDGPYGAACQAARQRAEVTVSSDIVPPWFLVRILTKRLAAARTGLEASARHDDDYAKQVYEALKTVEDFIRNGTVFEPTVEQVVAGLLGAQECEEEHARSYEKKEIGVSQYVCRTCRHAFYMHRESNEWQMLNPRRKKNLTGCTREGCGCKAADDSHVNKHE
jgi:hypothetical protein